MKNSLKRLAALATMLVVLITCLTSLPFSAVAVTLPKLDIASVQVDPSEAGREIEIPIKIENLWTSSTPPNLTDVEIMLSYDKNLTFNSRENDDMKIETFSNNRSKHTLSVSAHSDSYINDDVTLFTLTFDLPKNMSDGDSYEIIFMYYFITDKDGEEITVNVSDGSIDCVDTGEEETEAAVQTTPVDIEVGSSLISLADASVGEEIAVPITISDNCGFSSTMFFISYDKRLNFVSCESGIIACTTENSVSSEDSSTAGIIATSATAKDTKKNGTLFTLYFTLPEDIAAGDSFTISITNSMLSNASSAIIKYTTTDGTISITDQYIIPSYTTAEVVTTTTTTTSIDIQTKPHEQKTELNAVSVADVLIYQDEVSEKVKVPIYIENNEGFSTNGFTLSYDSRLSISSSDIRLANSVEGNIISFIDSENSSATVIVAANNNVTTDGIIYWLYFTLPEDANAGDEYSVEISGVSNWQRLNVKGDEGYQRDKVTYTNVDVTTFAGSISIIERPVETTTEPETEYTTTTTITESEEEETLEIQPLSTKSKNIISVQSVSATVDDAGEQIQIPIYISKNEGVSSIGFIIDFDSKLKITDDDVNTTPYHKGSTSFYINSPIHIISIATAGTQNTTGDVALYYLQFTLPSKLKVGDKFNISISKIYTWSHLLEAGETGYEAGYTNVRTLDVSVLNGSISIVSDSETAQKNNEQSASKNISGIEVSTPSTSLLLGDADLNGVVDSIDAAKVLKEFAKKIVDSNYKVDLKTNADVNFDNQYTSTDAAFILKYYAKKLVGYNKKMDPFMESLGYKKK